MNNHFRIKPAVVTAITFAQLVQHGRDNGANIVNGMPWSFQYAGRAVSHENDLRYLVTDCPPLGNVRTLNVLPGDMLVTDNRGAMEVMSLTEFNTTFEPVSAGPAMHVDYYRDLIVRAVAQDGRLLDSIATQLAACTEAHGILRAKGYGHNGLRIDDTARLVPDAGV